MNTKKVFLSILVFAVTLGGCGSHHQLTQPRASLAHGGFLQDRAQVERLERSVTDGDIARLLDADVRAKLPTKLAVAKVGCGYRAACVAPIGAEELNEWEQIIARHQRLFGVQPVSPTLLLAAPDPDEITLRDLREAAARTQCELLLVYTEEMAAVENYNDAAALYWTFVGLWLVPGNVLEQKTAMQAILVDCRTGMVLGTATGDAHGKKTTPAAYAGIARDRLSQDVPRDARKDLADGVDRLLGEMLARADSR